MTSDMLLVSAWRDTLACASSPRIARTLLHTTIFGAVASLWVWHFGEIASKQPIAQKYGWFSSYMTYDAVTLQFAFFALAMVADFKGNLSVSQAYCCNANALCQILLDAAFHCFSKATLFSGPVDTISGRLCLYAVWACLVCNSFLLCDPISASQ